MFNNPYFIPNFYSNIAPTMLQRNLGTQALRSIGPRTGIGLFSRIKNSIKAINWTGMINNTSKTLGIINQTIPVVKQVGPMMNNMKSMLKIASVFKDETDTTPRNNHITNNNQTTTSNINQTNIYSNDDTNNYSPTFFISS